MQLRVARVCLDCEEVHDSAQCPVCASETFAFLSSWVPTRGRRTETRPVTPQKIALGLSTGRVVVGFGVLGGVALLLNRWLRTARQTLETAAANQESGELK